MARNIWIREKVYIPISSIDHERARVAYSHKVYDEGKCGTCKNKRYRHNEQCEKCPLDAYKGIMSTANYKTIKGHQCVGLPIGDKKNIEQKTGIQYSWFKIKDLRTDSPFRYKIKCTLKPYDYQIPVIEQWMAKRYGLIKAAPRTGKTAMCLYIACKLGQRLVVLADQYEFLDQFIEHIEQYTNLPQLQEKTGKKLYGYPKSLSDYDEFEICVSTYQKFMEHNPSAKKRLKALNKNYGLAFIDEIHSANSKSFSNVCSKLRCRYIGGLTATPKRKDGREFLMNELVGPVVASTNVRAMVPKIVVHQTGIKPRNTYKLWHYAMAFLAKNEQRNELIVSYVLRDLAKGRSIVIPLTFRQHISTLVRDINHAYGSTIAVEYVGGGTKKNKDQRNQVRTDARAGDIRVVIGIRRLLQRGINIPRWDTLYSVIPMSNEPNFEQESSRICTPLEGKAQPLIRMFVDNMGQSLGCFLSTIKHASNLGYTFTDKAKQQISELKRTRGGQDQDDHHEIPIDELENPTVRKKSMRF